MVVWPNRSTISPAAVCPMPSRRPSLAISCASWATAVLTDNLATEADNFAYEVGMGLLPGSVLSDGATMDVPKGVTTMIDAGAVFKLRSARIGVGSSNLSIDRSSGALQVLGAPVLLDASGNALRNASGAVPRDASTSPHGSTSRLASIPTPPRPHRRRAIGEESPSAVTSTSRPVATTWKMKGSSCSTSITPISATVVGP